MAPRKLHRKSRNGCGQCKKRRVKCDEGRPACRNCVRRQEICGPSSFTISPAQSSVGSPFPFEAGAVAAEPSFQSQNLDQHCCPATRLKELQLMHHYSTITYRTMGTTPQQIKLWIGEVPKEATQYDFLMDGVLSLAALHCAYLNASMNQDYTAIAMQYQNSGLRSYRTALNHINKDNYQAIFAFSIILMVLGIATSAPHSEYESVSATETISSVFGLLKGVELTVKQFEESLRSGMFSPFFEPRDENCASHLFTVPYVEMKAAMIRLRQRADFIAKYVGVEAHQLHLCSIDTLETGFREFEKSHTIGFIIAWPVMVPGKLIDLCKQRDPMALLIWVHYGVLALSLHDFWWGRNFGLCLVKALSRSLHDFNSEWDSCTEWARNYASLVEELSES